MPEAKDLDPAFNIHLSVSPVHTVDCKIESVELLTSLQINLRLTISQEIVCACSGLKKSTLRVKDLIVNGLKS